MRVALLTSLLVLCVSGGFLDKAKEKVRTIFDKGIIKEKLSSAYNRFKGIFNSTILKTRERLNGLRRKIVEKLTLSAEKKAAFAEKIKKWLKVKKDRIQAQGDSIDEINLNSGVGNVLYQGDIALTNVQADEIVNDIEGIKNNRTRRQAFKDGRYPLTTWVYGVFYYFDESATPEIKSVFKKGAKLWMKDTCINFTESESAPDRIRVFKGQGCYSHIGRINGPQELSLGDGCETVGTAAHELGHALGLYHTQSRFDRDDYILIDVENIIPDWVDQFAKQTIYTSDNYGLPYDYGHIMHYGISSASVNGKPTMVPGDPRYAQTPGSHIVSFYELLMLNKHYGCLDKCPGRENQCKNGGFPNPRKCGRCVCPSGYGGKYCNQKPEGCGAVYEASYQPQRLVDTIGKAEEGTVPREDFMFCNYWIKAPPGSQIAIKLISFTNGWSLEGCPMAGVEIKTKKDQLLTGYRFCSGDFAGLELTSETDLVPIITYNRVFATTTVLEYRIISSFPQPQPQTSMDIHEEMDLS